MSADTDAAALAGLLADLRGQAKTIANKGVFGWGNTMTSAADLIEHQAARIAELEAAVDRELAGMEMTLTNFQSPTVALRTAINWHVAVALDPAVSSDAQALIDRGAALEARQVPEACAWMWETSAGHKGVYTQDPASVGIDMGGDKYTWTPLYRLDAAPTAPAPTQEKP